MNKIYKVIWSKVRNCYVAVSEIAKRNGKSCTSVNCGAKANRGHAGMALSAAVGATLLAGVCSVLLPVHVALAAVVDTNTTINSDTTSSVTHYELVKDGGVTFTVGSSGNVNYIISSKSGNTITIQSGGKVSNNTNPISGWSFSIIAGINNNNLNSAGTISHHIAGGLNDSTTDSVVNNHVAISGGKVSGEVFGGFSNSGNAGENNKGNTVNISGGQVTGNVYGGYSKSGGKDASYNQVSVSDANASASANIAYGGYSVSGDASYNQVSVSGANASVGIVYGGYAGGSDSNYSSTATKNIVTISGGTVRSNVYGGYVGSGSGSAQNNKVSISGASTIGSSDKSSTIYGGRAVKNATNNTVNINLTTNGKIWGNVYGGWVNNNSPVAKDNSVTVDAGEISGDVYGGFALIGGSVEGNSVSMKGTVGGNIYGGIIGSAHSDASLNKNVENNHVTITNGTVTKAVYGGSNAGTGSTINNSVTINGGTVKLTVLGGYSSTGNVGGTNAGDRNTVTITDGTIGNNIFGGYVYSGSGSAQNNKVSISGTSTIGSSSTNVIIYGGNAAGSGSATQNEVEINLASTGKIWGHVIGGYSSSGNAGGANTGDGNTVTISGGTVSGYVRGGHVSNGAGSVQNNEVAISGVNTSVGSVYGGYSGSTGAVTKNTVTIEAGTVNSEVYGGYTYEGTAGGEDIINGNTVTKQGNTVTINGGTIGGSVFGGYVDSGSGSAKNNTVTIENGKVIHNSNNISISGGYVRGGSAVASNNSVTISGTSEVTAHIYGALGKTGEVSSNWIHINGGTIKGNNGVGSNGSTDIGGGVSEGNAINNNVIITAGTFSDKNFAIFGGLSSGSAATVSGNNVIITAGSFNHTNKSLRIVGGYEINESSLINNNTVNLYGNVSGLGKAELYGYYSNEESSTGTGNELHIGGIKSGLILPETVTVPDASPWTGTDGNKVTSVNNFSSIVLHKVNWDSDTPVLAAESFSNIGSLDVSKMELQGELSLGTMALLQSGAANFNFHDMKLTYKYNGNPATGNYSGAEISTSTSLTGLGTNAVIHTGVKADYDGFAVVEFKLDKTAVNLTIAPEWKSVTLGEMNWADGGYSISTPGRIVGDGLAVILDNFKVTGAEDQGNDSQLNLLSIPSGMSAIKDALNENVTVTLPDVDVKTGLTFSATRVDTVATDANKRNLIYTTGATNKVKTATFGAGVEWNTTMPYYNAAGSDYTFDDATAINVTGLTISFTDAQKAALQKDNSMTLISATGITSSTGIAKQPTTNTYAVSNTSALGSQFGATATGTVAAETGAVKYKISSVDVNTITLGSLAWGSTDSLPETWIASGDTTINASGFAYAAEPKATTALVAGDTATILTAQGLSSANDSKISGGTGKTVGIYADSGNGVKLDATATGHVAAAVNALNYVVDSITLNSIVLKDWNGAASDTPPSVPTGWTLKQEGETVIATINTNDVAPAEPIAFGEQRTLLTASAGYFTNIQLTGNKIWQAGGAFEETEASNGVRVSGTQTSGGVKLNETASAIIYEAGKTNVTGIKLEGITFENNDKARSFNGEYDLTTADITIGSSLFTTDSQSKMEAGDTMTIVDATGAITYAASGQTLKDFDAITNLEVDFSDTITDPTNSSTTIAFAGKHTDTLALNAESTGVKAKTKLIYSVGDKVVDKATLSGPITWSDGGIHYTNGSEVNQNGTKATYKFDENTVVNISGVQFNAAADPLTGSTKSMTLLKDVTGVVATKVSGTPTFTVALDQTNTKLNAKASGTAAVSGNDVTFTVSGVTLDKITVKSANGTADKVPANWTMAVGASIETDSMTVPELAAGTHVDILQSDTDGFFANVPINGANVYGKTQYTFTESDAAKSVTIAGTQDKGVTLNTEKKHLIYKAGTLDVASVTLGLAEWKKGATVFDRSGAGYNYAGVAALGTDGFAISYASPETVATGDSMTLLQANATLKDMAEQVKKTSYSFAPVNGVTVDAAITGSLEAKGGNVTYTATANQASKLTFTSVDWKDSGALMTRPSNITFAGADVDTTKINFQNVKELDANRKMTLVSDFGDSVGTITGTKYTVGAGLEGEGAASLSGSDLVFTTKTGVKDLAAQEQTHNTLMVMEAGMAVLAAGNEYVGQTMAELANPQNAAVDGTVTAASLGGSKSRYKTGSHVDSDSWNVAVAVGSKRELKKGSLEWGVFGEYGKSNYTLHSDAGRGDGDSHYAGGGLMAKWTNKHDVYTEASVRLGRLNDTASNLLRDAAGNGYGYDVHANYFGAHVGIGKIIHYKGGKSLDVYGKYFYTKRDGVDFASGGNNYSLDSVASSILRVGARYGTTDKKWNWYGGLAYEYEFDGKSEGTVDGVGIRAASIKGGSVRGEIGLRMSATKTNPWQTDISIYGYGGKHRGFGGSVNVAYMF